MGDEVGPATGKLASTQTRRPDSRYIFKPLANRSIFKTLGKPFDLQNHLTTRLFEFAKVCKTISRLKPTNMKTI